MKEWWRGRQSGKIERSGRKNELEECSAEKLTPRSSEAAQSDPVTSSGYVMMSVLNG